MLREFVQMGHCKFADRAENWEEAIRMSCEALEADGSIDGRYREDIIASVKKFGPYLVIMPEVALPHAQQGASGVRRTGISFMKLRTPVSFSPGDQSRDVRLFFTLASCCPQSHLEQMIRLSGLLQDEETVEKLLEAETPEDLLRIQDALDARKET